MMDVALNFVGKNLQRETLIFVNFFVNGRSKNEAVVSVMKCTVHKDDFENLVKIVSLFKISMFCKLMMPYFLLFL